MKTVSDLEMSQREADERLVKRLEEFLKLAREGQVHQMMFVVQLEDSTMRVSSILCHEEQHVVTFLDRVMDATEKLIERELGDEQPEPVTLNG